MSPSARPPCGAYPLGRTAPHLLGYVGSATQEKLGARKRALRPTSLGDEIGKTGHGAHVRRRLPGLRPEKERARVVDAAGDTVRQLSYDPPVPGNDVYLSIDANVQAITENALRDELQNAHNRRNKDGSYNQSPAGAAVILDPNTGQVIAMASFPDYDPATFVNGISSSVWDPLQDPPTIFPLNNRASGSVRARLDVQARDGACRPSHRDHHAGDDDQRRRSVHRPRLPGRGRAVQLHQLGQHRTRPRELAAAP